VLNQILPSLEKDLEIDSAVAAEADLEIHCLDQHSGTGLAKKALVEVEAPVSAVEQNSPDNRSVAVAETEAAVAGTTLAAAVATEIRVAAAENQAHQEIL
jgi:hypothetical protein